MNKVILFRADATFSIGSGHIMRCLTIAQSLQKLGYECVFVTADGAMAQTIDKKGFKNKILNSKADDLESEKDAFLSLVYDTRPQAVVIDSYYVTKKYLQAVTDIAFTIYIDDIAQFNYPVNAVINYNIYAKDMDYSYCENTCLGCKFAPLRDEFYNAKMPLRETVKNMFISTGGSDSINMAQTLLKKLCDEKSYENIDFHIVIGAVNENAGVIKSLAQSYKNIVLHIDAQNIAHIMQECDVAVSASGFTLYELCCVGVPTVCYTFADNQLKGARAFEGQGAMLYAGDARKSLENVISNIDAYVKQLFDIKTRKKHTNKMQEIINGNGADNIAQYILQISKQKSDINF